MLDNFLRDEGSSLFGMACSNNKSQGAAIVTHIRHEINLHINECKEFGLTQEAMEKYDESQGM